MRHGSARGESVAGHGWLLGGLMLVYTSIAPGGGAWAGELFSPPHRYAVRGGPVAIAALHLDSDGLLDMVTADSSGEGLSLLLNAGSEGFHQSLGHDMGNGPTDLAVADMDADGHDDLVVASPEDRGIGVLFANGAGGFGRQAWVELDFPPHTVITGDLDGDGRADVVAMGETANEIGLWRNDGMGRLVHLVDLTAEYQRQREGGLWVGDIEGDGDEDVLAVGYQLFLMYLNDGTGTGWTRVRNITSRPRVGLIVEDFDEDGDLDPLTVGHGVSLWRARTPGAFLVESTWDGGGAHGVCGADVDEDGAPDAVTADADGWVTTWLGGGPEFLRLLSRTPLGSTDSHYDIACGDLDGDGDVDVAVSDRREGEAKVLYNQLVRSLDLGPQAHAGWQGWAVAGDEVVLDGTLSADPEGEALAFSWRQIDGAVVTLKDGDAARARFAAPPALDTLRFGLSVSDGSTMSAPDTVGVPVRPLEHGPTLQDVTVGPLELVDSVGFAVTALAIGGAGPGTVYAGTRGGGVRRSRDGGETWQWANGSMAGASDPAQPAEVDVTDLAVDPEDADHVVAAAWALYVSRDGGEAWVGVSRVTAQVAEFAHGDLYVGGGEGTGLVRAAVGSTSYADLNGDLPGTDVGSRSPVHAFGVDPFDSSVMYVAAQPWFTEVLRTEDGHRWVRPEERQLWGTLAMAISPVTGWVYCGTERQDEAMAPIWRSRHLGRSWEPLSRGLEGAGPVRALEPDPHHPLVLYAGTRAGVFWTGDGGDSWQQMPGLPRAGPVKALALSSAEPRRLYVGTEAGQVYRLSVTYDTGTAVEGAVAVEGAAMPARPALGPSYPNPFNGHTAIRYSAPEGVRVRIVVHDLLGQRVATLLDEETRRGAGVVWWDGRDQTGRPAAAGIYLCRLESALGGDVGKLLLLR